MLRPAVAAANCARAEKRSGLDIGRRLPVAGRTLKRSCLARPVPQGAQAGGDRQRDAENSVIGRYRLRGAVRPGAALERAGPAGNFLAGYLYNHRQNVAFSPYIKSCRGHYDAGSALHHGPRNHSLRKAGWPPMDTSHLAEHAGTSGQLFASVFVVATISM